MEQEASSRAEHDERAGGHGCWHRGASLMRSYVCHICTSPVSQQGVRPARMCAHTSDTEDTSVVCNVRQETGLPFSSPHNMADL